MPLPTINYNDNVPNPPNNPSVDVTPMQQNTNALRQFLSVDHVNFASSGSGTHLQANLLETSSGTTPTAPPLVGGAGYETLFSSTIAEGAPFGTAGELFFIRGANPTDIIQLTGPGTPDSSGNFGITFLPGGFLLQWGKVFSGQTSSGVTDYLFNSTPPNITFPVKCMQIFLQSQVTVLTSGCVWSVPNFSASAFRLVTLPSSIPNGTTFSWMAIGF